MADRGRHQLATDNEADVIANGVGHIVPDTYGTGNQMKFGNAHAKKIHDPYDRYGNDAPLGYSDCSEDYE
jgi:hypothetical protein